MPPYYNNSCMTFGSINTAKLPSVRLTYVLCGTSLSKLQTLVTEISQEFLLKKLYEVFAFAKSALIFFFKKNIRLSVFDYKMIKYLTSCPLNDFFKLKMLSTTGSRCSIVCA